MIVLPQSRKGSVKMKKIYIAGIDCKVSQAIRYALEGRRIVVPEEKNGKPSLELINFTGKEAREFFNEISDMAGVKAELVIR